MSKRTPSQPTLELPPGTVELTGEVVPAVRDVLRNGLPEEFLRSCVRIGTFRAFSGGLKAQLVGGLRIDVHAVLKLGHKELERHAALMLAVNRIRPRTFPILLHTAQPGGSRVLVIMEELRGHATLLEKVYSRATTSRALRNLVGRLFDALRAIHAVEPHAADSALRCLPTTREPFMERLTLRLAEVFRHDPALAEVMERPGEVMGQPCPSGRELLASASAVSSRAARSIAMRLVHGDPHLANVMVRGSGRDAFRVRLIDPNPDIGFSQPLYDIGKLLHWAEPVGWAKARPTVCRASFVASTSRRAWRLDAWCEGVSGAAERRRAVVERQLLAFAQEYGDEYGRDWEAMLAVASASAHVGFAALLRNEGEEAARRFVVGHLLARMCCAANCSGNGKGRASRQDERSHTPASPHPRTRGVGGGRRRNRGPSQEAASC